MWNKPSCSCGSPDMWFHAPGGLWGVTVSEWRFLTYIVCEVSAVHRGTGPIHWEGRTKASLWAELSRRTVKDAHHQLGSRPKPRSLGILLPRHEPPSEELKLGRKLTFWSSSDSDYREISAFPADMKACNFSHNANRIFFSLSFLSNRYSSFTLIWWAVSVNGLAIGTQQYTDGQTGR